jgi:hypothetical protein
MVQLKPKLAPTTDKVAIITFGWMIYHAVEEKIDFKTAVFEAGEYITVDTVRTREFIATQHGNEVCPPEKFQMHIN